MYMNYSVVMSGAVLFFSVLYYIVWARRSYKGPIVETTSYSSEQSMVDSEVKY